MALMRIPNILSDNASGTGQGNDNNKGAEGFLERNRRDGDKNTKMTFVVEFVVTTAGTSWRL